MAHTVTSGIFSTVGRGKILKTIFQKLLLRQQLPETLSTGYALYSFWALTSRKIWDTKVGNHWTKVCVGRKQQWKVNFSETQKFLRIIDWRNNLYSPVWPTER